ncbi:MAG: hypothetical protein AAF616_11915 [Bacteroidota bacterium]
MNKKIVIASVLKPVDDVRSYWKIAQSLRQANKYEINIIGNASKSIKQESKITFHAHRLRRTQYLKRIAIRYSIIQKTLRIKPDLLIISTHELLMCALVLKCITGCKTVYDVQENYARNASMNGVFTQVIGHLIRLKEIILAPFIDQFWLAEKCYEMELSFTCNKSLIIENKALVQEKIPRSFLKMKALFSGTISEYSGAKVAMQWMQFLHSKYEKFEGIFIGQIHSQALLRWLKKEAQKTNKIQLICTTDPMPYEQILEKISWANLGIISYLPNQINESKFPTKLYEYSRYKLPYLVQEDTKWQKEGSRLGGAIPVDFKGPPGEKYRIKHEAFESLFPSTYPTEDTWES